jgi:hypothetical protein
MEAYDQRLQMKPSVLIEIEKRFRARRFNILKRLLAPLKRPLRVLDVGGRFDFWKCDDLGEIEVTLLNIEAETGLPPGFIYVLGDGRSLSRFSPSDFDVVISNSTIGHVGDWYDQRRFAEEIVRVAKRYFIQTPNQFFPIDWRTGLPYFHLLPLRTRAWYRFYLMRPKCSSAAAIHWAGLVRNLSYSELALLFPGATIKRERLFGFTKSFMVYKGF